MSARSPHPQTLSVLVADEQTEPVDAASRAVEGAGHRVVARVTTAADADAALELGRLDAAVVVVHADHRHALELVRTLAAGRRFPVLLLAQDDDPALVAQALDAGAVAYTSRDTPAALECALEVARRRDVEHGSLARQIRDLEEGGARRAVIEQAKGVVMERHGVDERAAYELLRHEARTARVPVAQIARSVLEARALF